MKVQDSILEEWKRKRVLVFLIYKEYGQLSQLKGQIIDFDKDTIVISSFKNFVIINRKTILKIKGEKNEPY